MTDPVYVGVDFGTTNSAVAIAGADQASKLVALTRDGEATFRSILFFDADERGVDRKPLAYVGDHAIEVALDPLFEGRLIQSIKSYLANSGFHGTAIHGSRYALSDLVSIILRRLKEGTQLALQGAAHGPVVAGRPARFVGHEEENGEDLALTRLRDAYRFSGFGEVEFEFEPVAAAYSYAARLDHDELVLIADFGGGTSDFCLLTVGPSLRAKAVDENAIIAVDGVGLAGDAFDARIVENVIAERLGRGLVYTAPSGKALPMPGWIYEQLKAWHRLSFINSPKTHAILDEVIEGALDPAPIQALQNLVRNNFGFQLYQSVERVKHALSFEEESNLQFSIAPLELDVPIKRQDFESWIAPELQRIETCVDAVLKSANVRLDQVDRVFMTGGSAFVPAVRRIFEKRFGSDKLQGGEELTSVASGLAMVARDRFG
jgi:hypothetical chaperone protein